MEGFAKSTRFLLQITALAAVFGLCLAPASGEAQSKGEATETKIESGVRRWHDRGAGRIALPDGYRPVTAQKRSFSSPGYVLDLYAQEFAQGRAVYVEVLPAGNAAADEFQAHLRFQNKNVPLSKHAWGYRGFIGISPYEKIGAHQIQVTAGIPPKIHTGKHSVQIADTKFPVFKSAMNLGKFSDQSKGPTQEQLRMIREGRAKKNRAFALVTDANIADELSHPRDLHKITSPFWATRIKQRYTVKNGKRVYLKPKKSVHGGLDLRAVRGAPIHALARGRVFIAEPFYYEGKFTVLDHGQGVISMYMHQSEILVKESAVVDAGEKIGLAGATGAVTGAHLHIAVYIRRVPVEPLSFLSLPVRD